MGDASRQFVGAAVQISLLHCGGIGMTEKSLRWIVLLNVLGILLYTLGLRCFAVPAGIAPGGASGIAILVNYMTGCPVGLFCSLFNLPIIVMVLWKRVFPFSFVVRAIGSIGLLSVMTDLLEPVLPVYLGNALLAALFAGAFMGSGLALVYLGNSDTGGITMLGLVIQKHFPHFQVGTLVSGINILIVLASGIVYRSIDNILYAAVTVYISGLFMDRLVDNANAKDLIIVMSANTDMIRCAFLEEKKGITILRGEGGYTSETQRVIMGAAHKSECARLRKKIEQLDPDALVIVASASRVTGKNFGHMI